MPIYVPGKVVLRKTWQPMDADAAAYITAVETADGQALEEKVKIAIDNFVLGCKADGIWNAIKASCILAGARTLAGALVPLVGTAPTNFNFVAGDYNRKTGLVGDGSTKYLDSNRALDADPLNSFHASMYVSSGSLALGNASSQGSNIIRSDNAVRARSAVTFTSASLSGPYFTSMSRADSSGFSARVGGVNYSYVRVSGNTDTETAKLWRVNGGYAAGRLAFYSIGESLDLALLDARVTDLINAFGVAIP
jgi:hypothetical protein